MWAHLAGGRRRLPRPSLQQPSAVPFDLLGGMLITAAFIIAFIRLFHPLTNLQLLQSVFVHLPFGQYEADDPSGQADHPAGKR